MSQSSRTAPVFTHYPGIGEWAAKELHYSQAVRIGDTIRCSGQGGWEAIKTELDFDNIIPADLDKEIDEAFENCDFNLKHAGGKGWETVYKVVTYATDLQASHGHIVRNLKKWMPNHRPIWTELGVKELGLPVMHFEIDVESYEG